MDTEHSWFTRLRGTAGADDATVITARAVGELSGAAAVGVFLLNETKDKLLFFASWLSQNAAVPARKQEVSSMNLEDPLCLALHNGSPRKAVLQRGMPAPASLRLLGSHEYVENEAILAYPLLSHGHVLVGGVLVCFTDDVQDVHAEVLKICDYSALLLYSLNKELRADAQISLLHEDISRIEGTRHKRVRDIAGMLIGQSQVIQEIRERICKIACSDSPVLITGETGTGKEVVATAIHAASLRSNAPFVKINCAALPGQLLESELFGHKKGAFSGADANHIGLLRSADGGTIFLDEIGEMPPELQAKLLRVLQDHEVRPVGDVRSYPVNIRIVSATNKDISKAIEKKSLRKDLYYRLSELHIHMPPLRERKEDIPVLSEHFTHMLCEKYEKNHAVLSHDAVFSLSTRPYPGNIRELKSYIAQAVMMSTHDAHVITAKDFPFEAEVPENASLATLPDLLSAYENSIIHIELERNSGSIDKAAKALGIPGSTLRSKVKKGVLLSSKKNRANAMKKHRRSGVSHGYHV